MVATMLAVSWELAAVRQHSGCRHEATAPAVLAPVAPPPSWRYVPGPAPGDVALEATIPSWVFARDRRDPALPCLSMSAIAEQKLLTSQDEEDSYAMRTFFAGRCGGVMLESGALDGVIFSVSNAFVRGRGWRAVHVEASSSYARLALNRPESLNLHAALCNHSQPLHWLDSPDPSSSVNGFYELMSLEMRTKFFGWATPEVLATLPATTCRPVTPLLDVFGITHVDLWVLDVEGSELMALQGVDWARTVIDVVSIEALQPRTATEQVNEQLATELLSAHGYSLHSNAGRNLWWVRDGFVPRGCADLPVGQPC